MIRLVWDGGPVGYIGRPREDDTRRDLTIQLASPHGDVCLEIQLDAENWDVFRDNADATVHPDKYKDQSPAQPKRPSGLTVPRLVVPPEALNKKD